MICSLLVFLLIGFIVGFESVEYYIILRRKILGFEFNDFWLEKKKIMSIMMIECLL